MDRKLFFTKYKIKLPELSKSYFNSFTFNPGYHLDSYDPTDAIIASYLPKKMVYDPVTNQVYTPVNNPGIVSLSYSNLTKEALGFIDLCLRKGLKFKVSEGFATTGHADDSRHYEGGAIDIVPENFATFKEFLKNDPEVKQYMLDHLGGLIDEETNSLNSVNWSGAHLHFSFKTPKKNYGEKVALEGWLNLLNS